MKVAVIGGGYAGLAAAVTLAGRGVPVTVYEAARTLGGRARRVEHRDTVLDNGLHILIGAYTEILRLMRLGVIDFSSGVLTYMAGDNPEFDVDPALEAICRKAMARRRYARYQRATELAEDVQRWMAGEPVTAYAENAWQRARMASRSEMRSASAAGTR